MEETEWFFSTSEEYFSGGPIDTKEAAISECICENDSEVNDIIYVGFKGEYLPKVFADSVIESAQEDAYEEVGEAAESWLSFVKEEELLDLSKVLNEVFYDWLSRHSHIPHFYPIKGVEAIAVTQELIDSSVSKYDEDRVKFDSDRELDSV